MEFDWSTMRVVWHEKDCMSFARKLALYVDIWRHKVHHAQ